MVHQQRRAVPFHVTIDLGDREDQRPIGLPNTKTTRWRTGAAEIRGQVAISPSKPRCRRALEVGKLLHAGTCAFDALDKPKTPPAERPKLAVLCRSRRAISGAYRG